MRCTQEVRQVTHTLLVKVSLLLYEKGNVYCIMWCLFFSSTVVIKDEHKNCKSCYLSHVVSDKIFQMLKMFIQQKFMGRWLKCVVKA